MEPLNMNKPFVLIGSILVCVLLYFLAPILTPFLIGALLAYLTDPLVDKLMRYLRMPRLSAVIIVFTALFCGFLLLILLFIPLIQKQLVTLAEFIPKTLDWFQKTLIPWVNDHTGMSETFNLQDFKNNLSEYLSKAGTVASGIFATLIYSGFTLVEWIINLVLIPVVTFYLLRDWNLLINGIDKLIPRKSEPTVAKITKECDEVLSAFFRGQLLVMLSLAIYYSIALSLAGLKIGIMIGLIVGLISVVPYLGFIVGVTAATIAGFVQFGSINHVIIIWGIFVLGQVLESMVLTPQLIGDRIGLHPVAVIFAILAGGALFGFFGILLALPVAAVLMVLVRFFYNRYRKSEAYRGTA